MGGFVREPDDLILDRRAVPRSNTLDVTAIHGRPIQIISDDLMGFFVGMRDCARNLAHKWCIGQERKHHRIIVTGLFVKAFPIYRLSVQPWWSSGL